MGHAGALSRARLFDLVPGACWGGGGPPPDHLRGAPRRLDCRGSSGAALTAMLLGVGGGGWRGPSLRRAPRASRADPEQGVQEQVDKFEKTISVAGLNEVEIGKMRNRTSTARNQANTLAGRKNNEVLFSEIQIQLRCQKYTVDVKATSDSKVNDELFWQKEELEKYKEEAQANKSYMLQAITVAVTKKNTVLFSKIHSQLKGQKYTVDVKATSDSKVITTVTVNELYTPTLGLKGIISIPTPYQKSSTGKVELQYLHSRAGINASVGLNANPLVNFSGVLGTKAIAFGVDAAFDTASGNFTKYNAGVSHTNQDFTASLNLNSKRDTENIVTIGSQWQHELDPPDHRQGALQQVRHLLQHAWRPSPSSPSQPRSTPRPSRRAPS